MNLERIAGDEEREDLPVDVRWYTAFAERLKEREGGVHGDPTTASAEKENDSSKHPGTSSFALFERFENYRFEATMISWTDRFSSRRRSMSQRHLASALAIAGLLLLPGQVVAQGSATPQAVLEPTILVLIEHASDVSNIDVGEAGPSAGDTIVWGPNALYDEADELDTGATTQGVCVALNATGQCMLMETILFADGSTIELQGIQAPGAGNSTRTIVGGSGQYRGATGSVEVEPTDDLTVWVKTFEIWL